MINLKKKDPVADAVKSILQIEEGSTEFAAAKGPKHTDALTDKLINKVEGDTPEETSARKSVKASGGHVEQPKVGVVRKESVSLKGFKARYEEHSIFEQMVNEVLSKDADAGAWIHDFVHSDNPKFEGKSKAERKKMALAAYYAKQRNEEVEQVEEAMGEKAAGDLDFISKVKGVAKKVGRALGGPDDEGHKKDLQRKMGIPQTGKPSMAKQNEEVESLDEGKMDKMSLSHLWHTHAKHTYWADQGYGAGSDNPKHAHHAATAIENHVRKHHGNKVADDMVSHSENHVAHAEYVGGKEAKKVEDDAAKLRAKHGIKGNLYGMHNESVNEGWDDMVKAAKDSVKSGPKPSGGSGVKQGTRYGGGKQTSKPEQDEDDKKKVNEAKRPEDDSVPFAPPFSSVPAEVTDKSGAKHTPMSRAHHLARLAMGRVKKDLGAKKAK
jgi:hypothetical protein